METVRPDWREARMQTRERRILFFPSPFSFPFPRQPLVCFLEEPNLARSPSLPPAEEDDFPNDDGKESGPFSFALPQSSHVHVTGGLAATTSVGCVCGLYADSRSSECAQDEFAVCTGEPSSASPFQAVQCSMVWRPCAKYLVSLV